MARRPLNATPKPAPEPSAAPAPIPADRTDTPHAVKERAGPPSESATARMKASGLDAIPAGKHW